jgi:hypothetical protein
MTDQELAQEVQRRIEAAEEAARNDGDRVRLRVLKRAHNHLERAWDLLMPAMDFAPLSGGTDKPPPQ